MTAWTKEDSALALPQGWDVFEIWDTNRLILEIQKDDKSNIFLSDDAAREYVKMRASATSNRSALCYKAWTLVFKSKVALPTKKRA